MFLLENAFGLETRTFICLLKLMSCWEDKLIGSLFHIKKQVECSKTVTFDLHYSTLAIHIIEYAWLRPSSLKMFPRE